MDYWACGEAAGVLRPAIGRKHVEKEFEITKNSVIADVLRVYPECITVFDRHDMPCRTCMAATTSTIADGALMHDVDAGKIVAELRDCCKRVQDARA